MRDLLKGRLPAYMVPAFFLTLEELPLTPSGKVDRRSLPDPGTDRPDQEATFAVPRDELENTLKEIWQWVLGVNPIGIRENFFDLGGHSLLAVQLFAHIGKFFGISLPLSTLFHAPTIEELAEAIRREGWSSQRSCLVPVHPSGSRPPFFCVHPHDGDAFRFYDLALMLGPDQPFYGLRAKVLDGRQPFHHSIEEMAGDYVKELRSLQPEGPYFLGGHCFGGIVAFEMARQLLANGEKVALVALIFSHAPGHPKELPNGNPLRNAYYDFVTKIDRFLTLFPLVAPSERGNYLSKIIQWNLQLYKKKYRKHIYRLLPFKERAYLREQEAGVINLGKLSKNYIAPVYPGRLTLFRTEKEPRRYIKSETWGWGDLAAEGVEVHELPGYPQNQDFKPRMRILGEKMKICLDQAQATSKCEIS